MSTNPFDNIPNDVVAALSALTSGADASAEYGMSRVRRWWGYVDKQDTRYTKNCLITPELKFDDEFKYYDANGNECKVKAFKVQFNYTLLLDDGTTHEQEGEIEVEVEGVRDGLEEGGLPCAWLRCEDGRDLVGRWDHREPGDPSHLPLEYVDGGGAEHHGLGGHSGVSVGAVASVGSS